MKRIGNLDDLNDALACLSQLERFMAAGPDEDLVIDKVSFKNKAEGAVWVLLVATGYLETRPVVAFYESDCISAAITGFMRKVRAGQVMWRDDTFRQ